MKIEKKRDTESSSMSRLGRFYKDPGSSQYTVPEPFDFTQRNKNRAKSIRERRVEEMIKEKQAIEEEILKFKFRAKSVPSIVSERR